MGVLAKKSTFLKLYAFCHSFHSKKHKIIWKPCKQLICIICSAKLKYFLVHFVIAIDYVEKTSVLPSNRNRVILVNVSQLQMAITFFALDRLSQLGAQMKGICQPNPTV